VTADDDGTGVRRAEHVVAGAGAAGTGEDGDPVRVVQAVGEHVVAGAGAADTGEDGDRVRVVQAVGEVGEHVVGWRRRRRPDRLQRRRGSAWMRAGEVAGASSSCTGTRSIPPRSAGPARRTASAGGRAVTDEPVDVPDALLDEVAHQLVGRLRQTHPGARRAARVLARSIEGCRATCLSARRAA
jgi:hypothetical protein